MPRKTTPEIPTIAPPREALAFAIAIVKSTPVGTSARDYVLQLRNHLKRGRLDPSDLERSQYLDLVGYWKQRCIESEERERKLKSQLINAERANQLLGHNDDDVPVSSTKRKRPPQTTRKSNRAKPVQQGQTSAEDTTAGDMDLLEGLGQDGIALMEQIWKFQTLFRRPDAEPDAVCSSLVGIARSLGCVLCRIAKCYDRLVNRTPERRSLPTMAHDKSEFSCAISACGRAFGMLLLGLESLNDDSPGTRLPALVIYECVKMFSTALDAIEASARQSAAKKSANSENMQESLAARGISHFLVFLIGVLEKGNLLHQKLFDGFTFVLFERVSKRLYYCVFGRHRSATIDGDMAPLPNHPTDIARQETESLAIRFEVRALVHILQRAMGRASDHMNPQTMNKRATTVGRTLSMKTLHSSRARLSPIAKDRLQRTLVACMYGDKVEDDFMDILTMPVSLGEIPNLPKVTDPSVEEWYQNQVWKLVGWDIMARERKWMG